MAMKPNYRFERSERAKAKAQKKAAKLQAKTEKSEARKQEPVRTETKPGE